jgi:integrase/recombinase XerD
MGLGKQAKVLNKTQVEAALNYLSRSRYPARNRVILLLSVKAGLRAKEIANLTWEMVTTSDGEIGDSIHLRNSASKGRGGGRIIPLNKEL